MTMINSLTPPQQAMIRAVVAGQPNYLQRQALTTLRALERRGFVIESKPTHQPTDAGRALIDEEALNNQQSTMFHVEQPVEYSRWNVRNGVHQHEWVPATVSSVFQYHHVGLRFEDGRHKTVFARHIRAVEA